MYFKAILGIGLIQLIKYVVQQSLLYLMHNDVLDKQPGKYGSKLRDKVYNVWSSGEKFACIMVMIVSGNPEYAIAIETCYVCADLLAGYMYWFPYSSTSTIHYGIIIHHLSIISGTVYYQLYGDSFELNAWIITHFVTALSIKVFELMRLPRISLVFLWTVRTLGNYYGSRLFLFGCPTLPEKFLVCMNVCCMLGYNVVWSRSVIRGIRVNQSSMKKKTMNHVK